MTPRHEHDACGVGFVAHIKGRKSHSIVDQGLTILRNLTHRGATGFDPKLGDGAGILIQLPDRFFREEMAKQGDMPAQARPVRRRHGVPAARARLAPGLRIRDRARDQGRRPGAARLARRAGRQFRHRRGRARRRAGHPAGVHRARRARDGDRRARAQAVHHPQGRGARHPGAQARARQGVLRAVDVGAHHRLQGHAAGEPGRRVLPRPQGRTRRVRAGAGAPALLDQHLPVLGSGAPVPHDRAQRRDQYGARQRQLDPRAPGRDLEPRAGRRPRQDLAADLRRPVGLGVLRQRPRNARHGRLLGGARGDDDDSRRPGKTTR